MILALIVSAGVTLAAVVFVGRVFPRAGWTRPNYAGQPIPLGAGGSFVLGGSLGLALYIARAGLPFPLQHVGFAVPAAAADPRWWLGGALGMATLGWLDDRYGSHTVRGFSAHVRALARGRLTTGGLKLLGGGLLALGATVPPSGAPSGAAAIAAWLADALLLALAINTVNAFDLRPGRAAKGWALLVGLSAMAGARIPWILPFVAAVAAYVGWDLRARMMMGDTGANALGALAGFSLVSMPSPVARWAAAAVLAAFHLWMERHSLTRWIAEHPAVGWLDRLGRPRP